MSCNLTFVPEPGVPPFQEEPCFQSDSFEPFLKSTPPETQQEAKPPPPPFKEAIRMVPQSTQALFTKTFRGKLVGIWPIDKNKCL